MAKRPKRAKRDPWRAMYYGHRLGESSSSSSSSSLRRRNISSGAYRSRVEKSPARSFEHGKQGNYTTMPSRAHRRIQSQIPRDDTGRKAAAFVPDDYAIGKCSRSGRPIERCCRPSRRADRVQLEELKIHLRARERINGRVERAPISRSP